VPDAQFSWLEIGIPFLRKMLSEMRIILLIKRDHSIPSETPYLILPKSRLCLYENEKLIN